MQKDAHPAQTAEELTTHQIFAEMAELRQTEPKETELKNLTNRHPRTKNGERPLKVPDIHSQDSFQLNLPTFHRSLVILAIQYVKPDLSTVLNHTLITICKGSPSVVWQQQIETVYTERYIKMHLTKQRNHRSPKYNQTNHHHTISVPGLLDYHPHSFDPRFQRETYWDDLYDQ